jgi:hypothetical protein
VVQHHENPNEHFLRPSYFVLHRPKTYSNVEKRGLNFFDMKLQIVHVVQDLKQ